MIAAQVLLLAGIATDVYVAAPIVGTEVMAEIFVCNQDPVQWASMDLTLGRTPRDPLAQSLYKNYSMHPSETVRLRLSLQTGNTVRALASTGAVACTVCAEALVTPQALEPIQERLDVLVEDALERYAEAVSLGAEA